MKLAQVAQLAFIGVAAAGVFGFVTVAQDAETRRNCTPLCAMHPNYAGRNRIAPEFELKDMHGRVVRLADFKGKTVVLNFWTKTCRPCLEEMPSILELANVVKDRKDVVILTVTPEDGPDAVKDTLKTVLGTDDPALPVLFDPDSNVIADRFGTHLFPETWIVDPHGVIRARFDGAREWSNAIVLDLINSVSRPAACMVEFHGGLPSGPSAPLCEESAAPSEG